MFAVSALIPSGSGSTLVTKVLGQVKADAPQLLAVLAGVIAIALVVHVLLVFIRRLRHQSYDDWVQEQRQYWRGRGFTDDFPLNSDGTIGTRYSASDDEVGDWAQFERDNYKALDDLDAEMKENDRLMRDL